MQHYLSHFWSRTRSVFSLQRQGEYWYLESSWIPAGFYWVSPKPLPPFLFLPALGKTQEGDDQINEYLQLAERNRCDVQYNRLRGAELLTVLLFPLLSLLTILGEFPGSIFFAFFMLTLLAVITDIATTPYFVHKAKPHAEPDTD